MNDFIIVVNKDKKMTSFDVIRQLKSIFKTNKIGHTGTLDPNATGVLVCAVNDATKLIPYLESDIKTYECKIVLGVETDTFDIWGKILDDDEVNLDVKSIDECLHSFIGDYYQTPTMYSANKVDGKKLYQYARENKEVELDKKLVHIYDLSWNKNVEIIDKHLCFDFVVTVSKGTYIRSLCHDIGIKLGTFGCMAELNRTKAGNYNIGESFKLSDIELGNYTISSMLESLNFPKFELIDEKLYKKVSNGLPFYLRDMNKLIPNYPDFVTFYLGDKLIAIYKKYPNSYKADRVWK